MTDVTAWLLRTAVGGGAVLLLGWWLARRLRPAAGRQRAGELALAAALLVPALALLPGWVPVPVPAVAPVPPAEGVAPEPESAAPGPEEEARGGEWAVEEGVAPLAAPEGGPAEAPPGEPPARPWPIAEALLGAYALVSAALLARWLLAGWLVHRLLRAARRAPADVQAMFDEISGGRRWRLLVSDRTAVPFSVGLWRPAVVLPSRMVEAATREEVEWALRHELTHLRRQDTRTCWLVALAQVVFFYLPWFWWLRRQVRLAQEMVADAAAAPEGLAADYAQFLLSWAVRPPAPVGATGVSGSSSSDLYRRIAMLLQDKRAGEGRAPRGWLPGVGAGLVALAVLAAGAKFQGRAAADEAGGQAAEEKKAEPAKGPKAKDGKKVMPGLEGLKGLDEALKGLGAGLDDEQMKELRQRMAEMRKRMEAMMKELPRVGGMPNDLWAFPGAWGRAGSAQAGRLGAQVAAPTRTLVEQLDLPKGQGLVLAEVGANSAAAKAGMKRHDILLELNGKAVPATAEGLSKLMEGIKADEAVEAVVLRKGKKETIKGLKLPEAKAQARPAFPALPKLPAFPALPGAKVDSVSITRNNDQFTAQQRTGGVTIKLKGKVADGKAEVSEVTIDDGQGQVKTYDSLDKVPAEHKEQAKKLAEMSAAGRVRVGRP